MSILDFFDCEQEDPEKEHTNLSWKIIEWKVAYYRPNIVHHSRVDDYTISDEDYDRNELRYLHLCKQLGHRNSVVHKHYPGYDDYEFAMFEIDESRSSVQLVINKLSSKKV